MPGREINMYVVIIEEITGPSIPHASFIGSPRTGIAPFDVVFTDQSSGDITSWAWDFGDGGTSTDRNPTHTYNSPPDTYDVTLEVSGPGGTDSETDYITIEENFPPEITSNAITEATQDVLYSYNVVATDPNSSDTITFSLDVSPADMQIDPTSGLITWTPTAGQVGGPHNVTVRAEDDNGLFDIQEFTITVSGPQPNQPPEITSTPVTDATEGLLYTYDVEATDPNPSDIITFSLDVSPTGMLIDPSSGLITWTPTGAQIGGPHNVTVIALDNGVGTLSDTQEFTITVEESGEFEIIIQSPADYEVGTLTLPPENTTCFIDRGYVFTEAPEQYIGLPFIRTANRDEEDTSDEFLTFHVNKPVNVYVSYDSDDASSLPLWLGDNFIDTGDIIRRDRPWHVWQAEYGPGQITLGGNHAQGTVRMPGREINMYVVIIEELE